MLLKGVKQIRIGNINMRYLMGCPADPCPTVDGVNVIAILLKESHACGNP